jgi:hypothetical protein
MKMTLKSKINMSREYIELIIYPYKPSAGLPNLVRLSFNCKSFEKYVKIVIGPLAASAQMYTFRAMHKGQHFFY